MTFVSLRPFAALGIPLCIAMTIARGALARASAARPAVATNVGGKR
jgi:hypothetical protein